MISLLLALAASLHAQAPSPLGSNVILGPDDEIAVKVLEADEVSGDYRIDSSGAIRFPLAGVVSCTGMTPGDLERTLAERFRRFIKNPQVSVRLTEIRSRPASIVGAVKKPGVYQIQSSATLLEMLSLAGGLNDDASDILHITRKLAWGPLPLPGAKSDENGQYSIAHVSARSILSAQRPEFNITIRPNDVITVVAAEKIYVMGQVKRAGGFVLQDRERLSVLQALAAAEGLTNLAKPEHARILRLAPNATERKEIAVHLPRIISGANEDLALQPGDILFVPNNLPKSATLRAVEVAIQVGTGLAIFRR